MTYDYAVTAARVVDGDTAALTIDLGVRVSAVIEVRLLGWDCPEKRNTPTIDISDYERDAARRATFCADDWFQSGLKLGGDPIRVQTEKDPGDRYGRWLGDVYAVTSTGPQYLGAYLAMLHLAVPYHGKAGEKRWRDIYDLPGRAS